MPEWFYILVAAVCVFGFFYYRYHWSEAAKTLITVQDQLKTTVETNAGWHQTYSELEKANTKLLQEKTYLQRQLALAESKVHRIKEIAIEGESNVG